MACVCHRLAACQRHRRWRLWLAYPVMTSLRCVRHFVISLHALRWLSANCSTFLALFWWSPTIRTFLTYGALQNPDYLLTYLLTTLVVNVEPLSDWPGSMCSLQPRPLESDFRSILFLWRVSTDYVTYCERLSRYEIPRGSVSLASGWGGGYRLSRHAEHTLRRRLTYLMRGCVRCREA